jgi:hypothetical protein
MFGRARDESIAAWPLYSTRAAASLASERDLVRIELLRERPSHRSTRKLQYFCQLCA